MPAATEPFTSAGTIIAIDGDSEPATYDQAGFEALVYLTIGEIADAGEFGRQYNLVTFNALDTRKTLKRKGSYNDGQLNLQLARVPADAGQFAALLALDSDTNASVRVTLQDGTNLYFTVQVMSYTTNIGNSDQITGATMLLEITNDIIVVLPA